MALLLPLALACAPQIVATEAPDWDAVFDRTSGWTGADGIYSIPLNGSERPGGSRSGAHLFVFSDTFIGDVNAQGQRQAGTTLVNNTLGYLPAGAGPDPLAIQFWWSQSAGNPAAAFRPSTPSTQPDEFYWMKDGIAIGDTVHLLAARFSFDPPPFSRKGVALISIQQPSLPPFQNQVQVEAPLYLPESATRAEITFGGAILDNSTAAEAPFPDEYVYVYGVEETPLNKKALVARVPRVDFTNFAAWTYWDGATWNADIATSQSIAGRVSTEMSVTPLPDGRFLMVFMLDTIGGKIAVRVGDRPEGPWGPYQEIYTCPIPNQPPGIFTYHAKAHPSLSDPGTLLVSYNVNTTGPFQDHFRFADIYRPRLIRLSLP